MRNIIEKLKRQQTRDSTAKMYYSIWKQFNSFLVRLDNLPEFWEDRLLLFIAYLVDERELQSQTVQSYISAIKRILVDDNYEWCQDQVIINSITRACRRINDKVTVRLPIHCGLLEMILFELERFYANQPYLEIMYKAMFALGYYGMMRIGELTFSPHVLKAKDVLLALNKEKLLLVLYTSKTHGYESTPQKIKISANKDKRTGRYRHRHFCPFRLMGSYMEARGTSYVSEQEAFFVFKDKSPVQAYQARSVLKSLINALNLNSDLYNTHSMHSGRCSDLIRFSYSVEEVSRMGRWRSSAVLKYIKD